MRNTGRQFKPLAVANTEMTAADFIRDAISRTEHELRYVTGDLRKKLSERLDVLRQQLEEVENARDAA